MTFFQIQLRNIILESMYCIISCKSCRHATLFELTVLELSVLPVTDSPVPLSVFDPANVDERVREYRLAERLTKYSEIPHLFPIQPSGFGTSRVVYFRSTWPGPLR